jgi:hypothetical protein
VAKILYVYAIGRDIDPKHLEGAEGVSGARLFETAAAAGLTALFSRVDAEEFSQEAIDRRSADLDWLGHVGFSHQRVNEAVARESSAIPLRAFALFSSEESLTSFLTSNAQQLIRRLERIEGKAEWTFRIDFDAEQWSQSLVQRVDSLRRLETKIASAPAGKAYLLRRKLDEEKKKAAREAEQSLLSEIEGRLARDLSWPTVVESRQRRAGSSPQITLLAPRGEESRLSRIESELRQQYSPEGVSFHLTGPWPPYTFAGEEGA